MCQLLNLYTLQIILHNTDLNSSFFSPTSATYINSLTSCSVSSLYCSLGRSFPSIKHSEIECWIFKNECITNLEPAELGHLTFIYAYITIHGVLCKTVFGGKYSTNDRKKICWIFPNKNRFCGLFDSAKKKKRKSGGKNYFSFLVYIVKHHEHMSFCGCKKKLHYELYTVNINIQPRYKFRQTHHLRVNS